MRMMNNVTVCVSAYIAMICEWNVTTNQIQRMCENLWIIVVFVQALAFSPVCGQFKMKE